ncbi:MAG: hypothetical protein JWL73_2342 [Actinomycetia bacterium]|nr:hypothetical protein [Actinomycetes bacterium]
MSDFHVSKSEHLGDAGFLKITKDTVEGPGVDPFTRVTVRHVGAVVVVAVDDDGRAVMVRQFRSAVDGDILEVVAGKRDVDGEPPAVTASRELAEEVGLEAGRLVPLAEFYNSPGFTDEYTYLFLALELESLGAPEPQGPEERAMTVERVPLAMVDELIATRGIIDAKSIIALLLAQRFLAGEYRGLDASPGGPSGGDGAVRS